MNQLNEKEIKYKKCIRCKQVDSETKFCETCFSKYCEKKYGKCFECKQVNTQKEWCQICNSKRFQQNFGNWTSGNDDIDKLIQNTQLTARNRYQVLEWIPYDRFYNIKYVAKGGFGKVYSAIWKDGFILLWDKYKNQLQRYAKVQVALKSLNESQNITLEFISEITSYLKIHENEYIRNVIKCHGISQDPITKEYIIVTNYARNGNLQSALKLKRYKIYNTSEEALLRLWINKLYILSDISSGLNGIHDKELIHRDLHVGNIVSDKISCITDMGLCKPANYDELEDKKYGVLPYMAPEILRGGNYTQASDIYSLGIIMYLIISGLPPYYNVAQDEFLALNICQGLRPKFDTTKVPQLIVYLFKRCLDANPLNRPRAKELARIFRQWIKEIRSHKKSKSELVEQIEELNNSLSATSNPPLTNKMIHSEDSTYKSRALKFNNLPEPKNSDDYYESSDNIIKYSEYFLKFSNDDCLECAITD